MKSQQTFLGVPDVVASGTAFCVTSAAMTLLNKVALSFYGFGAPTVLLCFQCTVTLAAVLISAGLGYGQLPPVSWRLVRLWLPVNVLFVGMIWTSFFALRYVGVAMVTVLKNLTSWLVITGDVLLFGKRYSAGVWASLVLMLVSALCGSATDLSFHAVGYAWQAANNVLTAGYSLALRLAIMRTPPLAAAALAARYARRGKGGAPLPPPGAGAVDELGMVVYNNSAALPMLLLLTLVSGEAGRSLSDPALRQPGFLAAAGASAAISFLISVSSMWFLSRTTTTIFSMVGALNKIPLAVLGMLLLDTPATPHNIASVMVGLAAGVVFARAKATTTTPLGASRIMRTASTGPQLPLHSSGQAGGGGAPLSAPQLPAGGRGKALGKE